MSFTIPEGKLYDLSMIKEISHGNNDFVKNFLKVEKIGKKLALLPYCKYKFPPPISEDL